MRAGNPKIPEHPRHAPSKILVGVVSDASRNVGECSTSSTDEGAPSAYFLEQTGYRGIELLVGFVATRFDFSANPGDQIVPDFW